MMFDSGMFLLSFDIDYIGWKHQAYCRVTLFVAELCERVNKVGVRWILKVCKRARARVRSEYTFAKLRQKW